MDAIILAIIFLGLMATAIRQYKLLENANIELKKLRSDKGKFETEKSKYIKEMTDRMSVSENSFREKVKNLGIKEKQLEKKIEQREKTFKSKEGQLEKKTRDESEILDKVMRGLNLREQNLAKAEAEVAECAKALQQVESRLDEVVESKYRHVVECKRAIVDQLGKEITFLESEKIRLEKEMLPLEKHKLCVEKEIFSLRQEFAQEMLDGERRVNETQRKTLKALNSSNEVEIARARDIKQSQHEKQVLAISVQKVEIDRRHSENEKNRQELEKGRLEAQREAQNAETKRVEILSRTMEKLAESAAAPKIIKNYNQSYTYNDTSTHTLDASDHSDRRSLQQSYSATFQKSAGARITGMLPGSAAPALEYRP